MSLAGFYINLDKSTDRDARMRAQLESLSLQGCYSRFSAVDGATQSGLASPLLPGVVGCFMSHFTLLRQNIASEHHLHVMEDDAIMSRHTGEVIQRIVESGAIQEYDLILTEAFVGMDIEVIAHYKKILASCLDAQAAQENDPAKIWMLDISRQGFACTSSYLINRSSIGKICGYLEAEVSASIRLPIDHFLRVLANSGQIRVGLTMPFITSIPVNGVKPSTIHGDDWDPMAQASALIRRMLYLDCDVQATLKEAGLDASPEADGRSGLILAAVRLALSSDDPPDLGTASQVGQEILECSGAV